MKFRKSMILIITLFLLNLTFSNEITTLSNQENINNSWKIKNWNENALVYWYPIGYINTSKNSLINYSVTDYLPNNFNSPSKGIIEIGNFSQSVTNVDIANNLTLSVYGWFPGLITSSNNWTHQKEVANLAATGEYTQGSIKVEEITYNLSSYQRKAILFTYNQNKSIGNQNTTLIYDIENGVLLSGKTEIIFLDLYILELELISSDLISSSNIETNSTPGFLFPVVILTLILIIPTSKNRQIKNDK